MIRYDHSKGQEFEKDKISGTKLQERIRAELKKERENLRMEFYHEQVETEQGIPARISYGGSGRDKLRYPLHWHHNLEFDLVLEGCIQGKIGGVPVEVHEGEIFFVNSGELHETDASGCSKLLSVTVLLSDQLLREYCPELDSYYFKIEQGSRPQRKLAELIQTCAQVHQARGEFCELELGILLRRICLILLRECRVKKEKGKNAEKNEAVGRIKKLIAYLEDNYESEITIQQMGELMGMTPTYFSRFFRKSTGQTFHAYLMGIRAEQARQRLTQSDATVTEIAYSCGFPNVKSFIETFKKEYGMTPARYRRENR